MKTILTITLLLSAIVAVSQPACPQPNNPVPLDSGIIILLAAGAAFGAKKMYDLKRNS